MNLFLFLIFYLQISDSIQGGDESPLKQYLSLQYALYITAFVLVIGGATFFYTSYFIVADQELCKLQSQGKNKIFGCDYFYVVFCQGIAFATLRKQVFILFHQTIQSFLHKTISILMLKFILQMGLLILMTVI